MKNSNKLYVSIFLSLLSFATAIVLAYYSHVLTLKRLTVETRRDYNREVMLDILDDVYMYRTPFTIDYDELESVRYSNYRCYTPFSNSSYERKYVPIERAPGIDDECWVVDRTYKLKADFQRKTVKARILGSSDVIAALDDIDSGFEEVLNFYLGHEYYMRAYPDTYEAIMPQKFDRLVAVLRAEFGYTP